MNSIHVHHVGGRDAGAAFDIPDAFKNDFVIHFYDADPECIDQINEKNDEKDLHAYTHHAFIGGPSQKTVEFKNNYDPYTSSGLSLNERYEKWTGFNGTYRCDYSFKDAMKLVDTVTLDTVTLDDFVEQKGLSPADVIILDTQGTEYDIIQGALNQIKSNTLALIVEVSMRKIYEDQKLFGDICELLNNLGFHFVTFLGSVGQYSPYRKKVGTRAEGFLAMGDALFLKDCEQMDLSQSNLSLRLKKLSFLSILFNRVDYGVECLERSERVPHKMAPCGAVWERFMNNILDVATSMPEIYPVSFPELFSLEESRGRFKPGCDHRNTMGFDFDEIRTAYDADAFDFSTMEQIFINHGLTAQACRCKTNRIVQGRLISERIITHFEQRNKRWKKEDARICIFGTGHQTEALFKRVINPDDYQIVSLVDEDDALWDTTIHGYPCLSPECISKETMDVVIISSYPDEDRIAEWLYRNHPMLEIIRVHRDLILQTPIENPNNLSVMAREYYLQIRKMFIATGQSPEQLSVLDTYQEDVQEYLIQDLQLHDIHVPPDQLLHFFLENLAPDVTMDVYAMPASDHTVKRIAELCHPGIRIKGFIDNFKSGLFHGLPVFRPSDMLEKHYDSIFVLAQDDGLQKKLHCQLVSLLPSYKHNAIILLGKGYMASILGHKKKSDEVANKINRFRGKRKSVLFAFKKFPVHSLSLVRELRRQGHPVFLMLLDREFGNRPHLKECVDFFDYIHVSEHYFDYFLLISKIKADMVYTMDFACETVFCHMVRLVWKGKMLHEIYDLRSLLNGLIKKRGGITDIDPRCEENLTLEKKLRPVFFNSLDGILYRGSPAFEDDFKKQYALIPPMLHYPHYSDGNDKYSFYDQTPHIVWCGFHLGKGRSVIPYRLDFYGLIRDIVSQNIHFHMYNMHEGYVEKFQSLSRTSSCLHIEKPLPFDVMTMMLSRYDWGFMAFYFDEDGPRNLTYASSFEALFFAYVSAGIPIICSEEYSYIAGIVKKYQNGFVVRTNDIPMLSDILKDADMEFYNDNAKRAKNELNIQAQYPVLEAFINGQ